MPEPAITVAPAGAGIRRDTWLTIGALALLTGLAWLYLFDLSRAMTDMPAMAMRPQPWDLTAAWLVFVMWTVMMVGMMLPSVAPVVLLVARTPGTTRTRTAVFVLAYVVVWTLFSAAATALQVGLQTAGVLSDRGLTHSLAAGLVLIAVGAYQWTPLKHRCLDHCRSPLVFMMAHWRPGVRGVFRLGLVHGSYCVGCCWGLMLLLFVSGVMNLLWAAGLATWVLLEKLLPGGRWLGRLAGTVLVIWGAAMVGPLG